MPLLADLAFQQQAFEAPLTLARRGLHTCTAWLLTLLSYTNIEIHRVAAQVRAPPSAPRRSLICCTTSARASARSASQILKHAHASLALDVLAQTSRRQRYASTSWTSTSR